MTDQIMEEGESKMEYEVNLVYIKVTGMIEVDPKILWKLIRRRLEKLTDRELQAGKLQVSQLNEVAEILDEQEEECMEMIEEDKAIEFVPYTMLGIPDHYSR